MKKCLWSMLALFSGAALADLIADCQISTIFPDCGKEPQPKPPSRYEELLKQAISENEPNDSRGSANVLKPGTPMRGSVREGEADWFVFEVQEGGTSATLEIPAFRGKVEVMITTSAGELVARLTSENKRDKIVHLGLATGRYFLLVSGDAEDYVFLLDGNGLSIPLIPSRYEVLLDRARLEQEPNDSLAAADGLEPGVPVRGQLACRSGTWDVDLFAIEAIRDDALLHFEMPNPPQQGQQQGQTGGLWRVKILDEGGNVLADRLSLQDKGLLFSVSLPRQGKHYVQIEPFQQQGQQCQAGMTDYIFNVTGEGIVAVAKADATPNFNDVELEPNDRLDQATPLTSGVNMKGHLSRRSVLNPLRFQFIRGDFDLYRIESKGNEILRFELCPDFHPCSQQAAWVLYVFNDSIVQRLLDTEIQLLSCGGVDSVNHPYLLADLGFFTESLIGTIDPTSGSPSGRVLEIAVRDPGVFYVGISSPLERDQQTGSVIQTGACPDGTTQYQFIREIFSDDQYLFRVFATRLDPVTGDDAAKRSSVLVYRDQVYLERVLYQGQIYEVYLTLETRGEELWARGHVRLLGTATKGDRQEIATFDGRYLTVPKVNYRGKGYRADLELIELIDGKGYRADLELVFKVVHVEEIKEPERL